MEACAASIVLGLPHLFTNSAEVAATMAGLTPLFCLTLMIHTSSMATEGIMLAGEHACSLQVDMVVGLLSVLLCCAADIVRACCCMLWGG